MSIDDQKTLRRVSFSKGLIGILLILASQPLTAGCPCNYTPATLIQVIGADTLLLNVADVEETVQIAGIQTPRLEPQPESDEAWCKSEGEKAIQAQDYATQLLSKASEISIDEQERLASGNLSAEVYIDNINLGQELLYKYLAIESGQTPSWCP
jgi:endonuclease YncB( thermonuclease family)